VASDVSISNRALTILGQELIIALTDDSNRARTIQSMYEAVRDAEFRRRRWRFTFRRATLPALGTDPDFDFARQFQLPSDYLRLIAGGDILKFPDLTDYRTGHNEDWSIEGDKILSNLSAPLRIRYIARVTDTSTWVADFCEAFAARLAYEACERITQSDTKKDRWRYARRQCRRRSRCPRSRSPMGPG
jgi:hypothetical protein